VDHVVVPETLKSPREFAIEDGRIVVGESIEIEFNDADARSDGLTRR
jgi:hypothetical protein